MGIQTPWGETGKPGQGINPNATPAGPAPVNPVPESKIPIDPPFEPSVFLNPEQQQANVEHSLKLRADHIYRIAIGDYARAIFDWKRNREAGSKAAPPIFAASFAATLRNQQITDSAFDNLPWAEVAALYQLPKVEEK